MNRHCESGSNPISTRQDFARQTGAGNGVCGSLERYAALLKKWQKSFNLVGASTLNDLWRRHFLDSAQLFPLISGPANATGVVVDLGSGAGFPGLVLSIMGASQVHLVESDANKTEFMRQVIRETDASATLHRSRIGSYDGPKADVVTSRACAPLTRLLDYATAVCSTNTRLVFLKGRNWQAELAETQAAWHMDHKCHVSCTDPEGIVLEINEFKRR